MALKEDIKIFMVLKKCTLIIILAASLGSNKKKGNIRKTIHRFHANGPKFVDSRTPTDTQRGRECWGWSAISTAKNFVGHHNFHGALVIFVQRAAQMQSFKLVSYQT